MPAGFPAGAEGRICTLQSGCKCGVCPFSFELSDENWMSLLQSELGRPWPWLSFGSLGVLAFYGSDSLAHLHDDSFGHHLLDVAI